MKKLAAAFLVVSLCVSLNAQDPFFLNSNQSLLSLNPSFAGSNGGFRNQFSYRNQWPNLSGRIVTYLNSADVYLSPIKAGVGVSVLYDDVWSGTYNSSLYSFSYAQHLRFYDGKLKLIPSLQMSYAHRKLDASDIYYGAIGDPRYGYLWAPTGSGPVYEKTYFDVSAGFLINYQEKFFAGASFFHLNQADVGFTEERSQPHRLTIHTSYNMDLTENTQLQFLCVFNHQQYYSTTRLSLNALFYKHLITGIASSSFDTAILSGGYRNNFFTLLVGYDVTISKLAGNTAGSWEIHASYNLRSKGLRRSVTSFETW